ncbi:nucleoside phosphatase family-domain-containing protein [Chytridium lagenaria]|nr:nucleoside phosphatase family-domain-containing protein [Chytridium lagenaria]
MDLHRRYGIVIDAGSSGSRVLVYSWVDPILMKNVGMKGVIQIEKGTKGISSLETDPSIEMVTEYLHPLLKFSASIVPKAKLSSTPIYLFATAGMRLVHKDARESILQNACKAAMRAGFSVLRGCESHFRVISGKTEGIFGWLTVNYLKGGFSGPVSSTFGFLDMGGASTQIAFEPDAQQKEKHSGDLTSEKNLQYNVFSTTFLGFGVNEARKTYLNNLSDLRNGNKSPSQQLPLTTKIPHSHNASHILGTGSLDECVALQAPLLNKTRACDLDPCFFNGVHGPVAKFSEGKPFLAASEYFYTPHSIYDLPDGPLSLKKWSNVDIKRVQMQCFKSAWLLTVLHEGLGAPKTVTTIEPVNEINGFSVSWTLGAMIIHVSGDDSSFFLSF